MYVSFSLLNYALFFTSACLCACTFTSTQILPNYVDIHKYMSHACTCARTHMQSHTHHASLLILPLGIPPNAHHHLVHGTLVHTGPPIVDTRCQGGREPVHYTLRIVSYTCRKGHTNFRVTCICLVTHVPHTKSREYNSQCQNLGSCPPRCA